MSAPIVRVAARLAVLRERHWTGRRSPNSSGPGAGWGNDDRRGSDAERYPFGSDRRSEHRERQQAGPREGQRRNLQMPNMRRRPPGGLRDMPALRDEVAVG